MCCRVSGRYTVCIVLHLVAMTADRPEQPKCCMLSQVAGTALLRLAVYGEVIPVERCPING